MTLLVALDDSDPGWAALEFALAERPESGIVVAHVVDPNRSGYGEVAHLGADGVQERHREQAADLFEAARERAAERDREIETALLVGEPASAVVDYAADRGIDRIVVGSHGRTGVSRVLLGSVAERIARRSPVPVTIVR